MKHWIAISCALWSMIAPAHAAAPVKAQAGTLDTIASLDVPRYMGTWYEIARFPNRFQKDCVSHTTATYALQDDGRVAVTNRCREANGKDEVAEGEAKQVGGASSPTLKVRFAPAIVSFLPFVWGDYWVVDLDADYQLAAVSEPGREYLWILSRTPTVDAARYQALVARLASKGLDVKRLQMTPQGK